MAGFQGSGDDDVVASINMVPMIDVVLVLLIIFIVTASAIVKAAIAVDLPKASTSEAAAKPPMSIILGCVEKQDAGAVAAGCTPGEVVVDGERVLDLADPAATVEPLAALVRQRVAESRAAAGGDAEAGALTVLITADKDLRFQNVIWMMDLLKNEGVASIMFNSELFTRKDDARALPR